MSRRPTLQLIEELRATPQGGVGMRPVRSSLTDREWEVLDLLSRGYGTDELVFSSETVRSHIENILRKLGVRNRTEAVGLAQRLRRQAPPRTASSRSPRWAENSSAAERNAPCARAPSSLAGTQARKVFSSLLAARSHTPEADGPMG